MDVQPVSTRSVGRRGSKASLLALALPVAALIGTVTIAWAGRASEAPADPPAPIAQAATPTPRPDPTRAPERARLAPTTAFRLDVRTVEEALAAERRGELGGGLVAVSGEFSLDPGTSDCVVGAGSRVGTFCRRFGVVASDPNAILAASRDAIEPGVVRLTTATPQLGVVVPAGIALPTVVIDAAAVNGVIEPVPVIVVGRFDGTRPVFCRLDARHCGGNLVVERVAWAAGEVSAGLTVRSATVPSEATVATVRSARVIASREIDRGEPVLSRALLTFADLRAIHPAAAGAVEPGERPDAADAVWYVRSVARRGAEDAPRRVAWAVVDHQTGLVLSIGFTPAG